jgi:hypothetical protein
MQSDRLMLLLLFSPLVGLAALMYMERVEQRLTSSITEQQRNARNQRSAVASSPALEPEPVPARRSRVRPPSVRLSPSQARAVITRAMSTSRRGTLAARTERRVARRSLASAAQQRTSP